MRTFISYHNSIEELAGDIKDYLDDFAFNCFLAHKDIPPQTKWPKKIERELKRCDLFLPLLTPEFTSSFFCQQETGFAYCRGIEILSVRISEDPKGIIYDEQAIRFREDKFIDSCWKIVTHVAKKMKSIREPVLDALIEWFGESKQFDIATERAEKILNKFDFSPAQVRTIREYILENSQINRPKTLREHIFKFMDKYPRHFNKRFRDWYDSEEASRMFLRH